MKYESIAIHGGRKENTPINGVNYPIYLSSTFVQDSLNDFNEFMYSRSGNPTRSNVELLAAELEESSFCLATSSGMAATAMAFELLKPKDKVLINSNVYGGTWGFVSNLFKHKEIDYEIITNFNTYDFTKMDDHVRMIFIETPSNPLLEVTDIAAVCEKAKEKGVLVVVDNTFLTSYYQKPLQLGADIVVYSATKYQSGHSDILAGLIMVNDEEIHNDLKLRRKFFGGILSPFDSFLLTRGLKTLAVRMDRHEFNAIKVAEFLSEHPQIDEVFYPGLKNHPDYAIQKKQASGNGGLLSFKLSKNNNAEEFCRALKFFDLAVSLGGVESLICHPASMTHETYSEEMQEEIGICDNLFRLAVGVEHIDDLIEDLNQALEKSRK